MSMRGQFCLFTLLLVLFISVSAQGQGMTGQSSGRNVSEMKLTTIPPLPTCARGSVQNGDPSKGPSIIFAKLTTGCTIPWHWHTPNEHVIVVSGIGRVEMKDGKPLTLRSGGFVMLASHHVHQARELAGIEWDAGSEQPAGLSCRYVSKRGCMPASS